MAHFAEIDKNNKVKRVLVTSNEKPNEGLDWLKATLGGTWVKCSYNTWGGVHSQGKTPLRKNFPGIGWIYDADKDAFVQPKPSEEGDWVLNADTCLWEDSRMFESE